MFDLPVDTKQARRAYAIFRKRLMQDGFMRLQFSVYARPVASQESADVHVRRVESFLPDHGEIRILLFTDKQFERMRIFLGKMRKRPEKQPQQLLEVISKPH